MIRKCVQWRRRQAPRVVVVCREHIIISITLIHSSQFIVTFHIHINVNAVVVAGGNRLRSSVFFIFTDISARRRRHVTCRLTTSSTSVSMLRSPYGIGQTIIFLPCGFFFLSFFSSPNLSRRRLDVCHTSTWCGSSVNLGRRSETCCTQLAENAGRKKSPSTHHCTTLSGYIFATKARIDNRKKNC